LGLQGLALLLEVGLLLVVLLGLSVLLGFLRYSLLLRLLHLR
jgi:hypothetical protein